jgi:hypothetical protein
LGRLAERYAVLEGVRMSDIWDEVFYLVGDSKEEARNGFLWDDLGDAEQYAREQGYTKIYSISAFFHADTMDELEDADVTP